jgi:hypothetical protein
VETLDEVVEDLGECGLRPIPEFEGLWDVWPRGERLERVRSQTIAFRERFKAQGEVLGVRSFDIAAAPYPVRFAFAGAALGASPVLSIINRERGRGRSPRRLEALGKHPMPHQRSDDAERPAWVTVDRMLKGKGQIRALQIEQPMSVRFQQTPVCVRGVRGEPPHVPFHDFVPLGLESQTLGRVLARGLQERPALGSATASE